MKKQLLLGTALVTAMAANAQHQKTKPSGAPTKAPRVNEMSYNAEEPVNTHGPLQNQTPELLKSTPTGTNPVTWIPFANSINSAGVLVSNSRIINYNEDLDVVTFVHRKYCTYSITASGEDNSGVVIARIISKWNPIAANGTFTPQFDSTAFASGATNFPRYPNSGIYNPPGNTNINNAYIVACGPTTAGSGWTGNWYASKQLGSANYNNNTGTAPNQQWYGNPPTGSLKGVNFNRYNFCVTDDGKVRSVGTVGTDNPGSSQAAPADTSLYITTGNFAAGSFTWTGTELYPDFKKATDGTANLSDVLMAWNEAGTVGYAIVTGQNKTTTVTVNQGIQPKVWKTTNSGASWAAIPDMDFTAPTLTMIPNELPAALASNTNEVCPWFRSGEGQDAIVDKDDRLHFVTTIVGHSSTHKDSTYYIWSFTNGGDSYYWPHKPGYRPYIYDFTTTGTGWNVTKIDSLSSEAPRPTSASQGSSGHGWDENPWAADGTGQKPVSSSRIQLGRTPNGSHIYYSWAESDTLVTSGNKKWNTFPNIKVRVLDVATGSLSPKWNATAPTGTLGLNSKIKNYAYYHYASPKSTAITTGSAAGSYTMAIPMSVSNNQSLNGNGDCVTPSAVTHFFNAVTVTDAGIIYVNPVGLNEKSKTVTNMQVIPNPTSNNTNLVFDMNTDAKVLVSVTDVTGKIVKSIVTNANLGQNTVNINVNDLKAGIYFVSLNANNQKTTAKLIVE
ncbi:MAG: T9SS type A sorting domain-containing protein [Bacteroidetes bacterium]|nr:T9SS type A sorting domain-containing protein [Bacteroidota bacterium]